MEKSDRSEILHKIRSIEDGKPVIPGCSPALSARLKAHFLLDKSKLSKLARVRLIYALLDDIRGEHSNLSVCRRGCAHCCRIPVEITPLEVDYIVANTKHKKNKKPGKSRPLYCPMLNQKTAECSVYEYRPFNCRAFTAYDSPDYCRDDLPHFITGGPKNHYGSQAVWFLACELIEVDTGQEITKETLTITDERIADIRSFLG